MFAQPLWDHLAPIFFLSKGHWSWEGGGLEEITDIRRVSWRKCQSFRKKWWISGSKRMNSGKLCRGLRRRSRNLSRKRLNCKAMRWTSPSCLQWLGGKKQCCGSSTGFAAPFAVRLSYQAWPSNVATAYANSAPPSSTVAERPNAHFAGSKLKNSGRSMLSEPPSLEKPISRHPPLAAFTWVRTRAYRWVWREKNWSLDHELPKNVGIPFCRAVPNLHRHTPGCSPVLKNQVGEALRTQSACVRARLGPSSWSRQRPTDLEKAIGSCGARSLSCLVFHGKLIGVHGLGKLVGDMHNWALLEAVSIS